MKRLGEDIAPEALCAEITYGKTWMCRSLAVYCTTAFCSGCDLRKTEAGQQRSHVTTCNIVPMQSCQLGLLLPERGPHSSRNLSITVLGLVGAFAQAQHQV